MRREKSKEKTWKRKKVIFMNNVASSFFGRKKNRFNRKKEDERSERRAREKIEKDREGRERKRGEREE